PRPSADADHRRRAGACAARPAAGARGVVRWGGRRRGVRMSLAMIDVHDLLGHPGLVRSYDLLGTIDGLATELVAVPDDAVLGGGLARGAGVAGGLFTGPLT